MSHFKRSNYNKQASRQRKENNNNCNIGNCGSISADLSITAAPTEYSNEGEVITYTYTITNTGSKCISYPVTIYDNILGQLELPFVNIAVNESASFLIRYTITQADIDKPDITNIAYAVIRLNRCNLIHTKPASATIIQSFIPGPTPGPKTPLVANLKYDGTTSTVTVTGIPTPISTDDITITPSQGTNVTVNNNVIVARISGTPNATITITKGLSIVVQLSTSNNIVTLTASGIPAPLVDITGITLTGGTRGTITTQPGLIPTITIPGTIPIVDNRIDATLTVPLK